MKKYIFGALFGLILAAAMMFFGANTNGAPVLTYVYSDSMEPLIKVNDAFLVWPAAQLKAGDIIMYRPEVLKAPYITHRIIALGESGYITKGDNSPYQDQDSGEPEVSKDRIVGRVVTFRGQPLIVPGLGKLSAILRNGFGKYTRYLSGVFLMLGLLSVIAGGRSRVRKPKPCRRLRLRHIYRGIVIAASIIIMITVYFGSRVSQIKYLVSEYPGERWDSIAVNQQDQLIMTVRNNGLIPVWIICKGISPLSVNDSPGRIGARSSGTVLLDVEPHHRTGIYQGYVQVYHYPVLLPRTWTVLLHRADPTFANLAVTIAFGFYCALFFKLLSRIHGLEDWIPLRTFKDKITERRLGRVRAKLLGRRRSR